MKIFSLLSLHLENFTLSIRIKFFPRASAGSGCISVPLLAEYLLLNPYKDKYRFWLHRFTSNVQILDIQKEVMLVLVVINRYKTCSFVENFISTIKSHPQYFILFCIVEIIARYLQGQNILFIVIYLNIILYKFPNVCL